MAIPWAKWVKIPTKYTYALPKDRPYTDLEALFCLTTDQFNGKTYTTRDYSRMWSWSKSKAARFIKELNDEMNNETSENEQKNSRAKVGQSKGKLGAAKAINSNIYTESVGQSRGKRGANVGHILIREKERLKETLSLPPKTSPHDLFNAWNEIVKGTQLPTARALSKAREKKCIERLDERPVEEWREIFKQMTTRPYLCGQGENGWKADFDWIIANDGNAIKVLEGKYRTAVSRRAGNDNRYGMFAGA